MKVFFGYDSAALRNNKEVEILWDSQKVINGHMLIMGKSGTGKTYTLRQVLEQLEDQSSHKLKIHIMDVHGDIEIGDCSTVKFSESTQYGFNPLIVNPDPDFGGVRKRIQSFISTINRTSRKLGSKQESALRNILQDLYAANGFYDKQPKSWFLNDGMQRKFPKKYPTLEDGQKFALFKLKGMFLGTDNKTMSHLEALSKKVTSLYIKNKNYHKALNDEEREKAQAEIAKIGDECIESYTNYVKGMQTGMELTDLIKYDSKEVMKSVVERLENLTATGIFKSEEPPFDKTKSIWRYDIKALSLDEKKLFVYFKLEDIFLKAIQNGVQNEIREVIVLDEAHNFFTDESENIINIIAKEARKFGVALFCASQSPTHFSDDFLSNVGTKIILGIDQMFWKGSVSKLQIDQQALEWIVPHQKMVVQISNKGDMKNKYLWVKMKK